MNEYAEAAAEGLIRAAYTFVNEVPFQEGKEGLAIEEDSDDPESLVVYIFRKGDKIE